MPGILKSVITRSGMVPRIQSSASCGLANALTLTPSSTEAASRVKTLRLVTRSSITTTFGMRADLDDRLSDIKWLKRAASGMLSEECGFHQVKGGMSENDSYLKLCWRRLPRGLGEVASALAVRRASCCMRPMYGHSADRSRAEAPSCGSPRRMGPAQPTGEHVQPPDTDPVPIGGHAGTYHLLVVSSAPARAPEAARDEPDQPV